jgi:hypothetical protein
MIPKYCYYVPESETRGDKFVIDRHPKLVESGDRQWSTTARKTISTKDKYTALIEKLTDMGDVFEDNSEYKFEENINLINTDETEEYEIEYEPDLVDYNSNNELEENQNVLSNN